MRDIPRLGATQQVAIGAGSLQSTAITASSHAVRVSATAGAWILTGVNPTAAAGTGIYIPPNWVEYLRLSPGEKIAAIQSVGAGFLSITEVS